MKEWSKIQESSAYLRPMQTQDAQKWNAYLASVPKQLEAISIENLAPEEIGKMAASDKALPLALKAAAHFENKAKAAQLELAEVRKRVLGIQSALDSKLLQLNLRSPQSVPKDRGQTKLWITSIGGNGSVLVLNDGSVWEVDLFGRLDSSLWLSLDNVVVINGEKIVNTDQNEAVDVKQLR